MRPTSLGLEMHLVKLHAIIEEFTPAIVVIDPITALLAAGSEAEARTMLLRLIDYLKQRQITALMTTLTSGTNSLEHTDVNMSSLVDVWLLLREIESGGERNRGIYVIKARGLAHSNQVREFVLTTQGVQLRNVYMGSAGLLTGSARVAQEAKDAMQVLETQQAVDQQRLIRNRKRKAIEAQIAALQLDLESEDAQWQQVIAQSEMILKQAAQDRTAMARSRSVAGDGSSGNGKKPRPGEGRK
jgi:circadian clock protein KaiC